MDRPGSDYLRILRTAGLRRLYASSVAARVPQVVTGIALVLFIEHLTGSIGLAGAASGLYMLAWALSYSRQGRLIDRHGPRVVLVALTIYQVVSMLALVFLALAGIPDALLLVLAAAAGAGQAPWADVMRSLWPELLQPSLLPSAFALDGVFLECLWVVGPLLTGLATTFLSPQVALLGSSACALAGGLAFITAPNLKTWIHEHREDHHPLGALRSAGVRTLVMATIPVGIAGGTMQLAVAGFAKDAGQIGATGTLIAAWSLSSALGNLALGARTWSIPFDRLWRTMLILLLLVTAPVLLVGSTGAMFVAVFLAGSLLGPLQAVTGQLLGRHAPRGMRTEAYSWGLTSMIFGVAIGTFAGGALAEHFGWRAAVLLSMSAGGLAALLGFLGRETVKGGGGSATRGDGARPTGTASSAADATSV